MLRQLFHQLIDARIRLSLANLAGFLYSLLRLLVILDRTFSRWCHVGILGNALAVFQALSLGKAAAGGARQLYNHEYRAKVS